MNIQRELSSVLAFFVVSFCLTSTALPATSLKKIYILKSNLDNPTAKYVRGAFVYFDKNNGGEIVGEVFGIATAFWEALRQIYFANCSIDTVDYDHFPMDGLYRLIQINPAILPELLPHLLTRASRETIAEELQKTCDAFQQKTCTDLNSLLYEENTINQIEIDD